MKTLNATYVFLMSSNSLVMAYTSAITAMTDLPHYMRWVNFWVGVYGVWSNTMVALITTLAKREAAGKPLIPINGGTEFVSKTETEKPKDQG